MPFLSAYGREICRLFVDGQEISIPASTDNAVRCVLLRDGDQFETSAGRWSVERDDEQGTITTIHNSMRPPPFPEVPMQDKLELLHVLKDKDRVSLKIPPLPIELDESFVEDVPYSDDPPLDDKQEGPLLTSNHNGTTAQAELRATSTQGSSQEMLHNALDSMVDSSCERPESTDETTGDIDQLSARPTHDAAFVSRTATQEVVDATLDDPAHNRKKRKAVNGERTYRRKKTFTQRMIDQQQIEETIVVAPASPALESSPSLSTEKSPSPSKKEQKPRGRPVEEAAPTSTPGVSPTLDHKTPSPVPDSARSTRSHRSHSAAEPPSGSSERSPVMYFASNTKIDENHKTMKAFYDLGGKKAKSIGDADMLCVVDGQLKKSEAFLVAIAQGADIVTEEWVIEAHRIKKFPDRSKFMPNAKAHEQAWGFRLNEAIQRGKKGLTGLLSGTTVYITAQFKTDMGNTCYQGIKNVATALGAEAVKPVPKNGRTVQKALAIGVAEDIGACEVGRLGMRIYDKELLTSAVLKGHLDLDSNEYSIAIPVKEEDKD